MPSGRMLPSRSAWVRSNGPQAKVRRRAMGATAASVIEVLAQRRARVLRLRQPAPLQLGDHVLDEIVDVALRREAARQDEAAVGAGAVVQLLELVDDLLRGAARRQHAVDQEAPAELFHRLLGIDGLEQLLEAAEVALVGLHLVGE